MSLLKILFLGVDDNRRPGHPGYDIQHLPLGVEGRMVVLRSCYGDRNVCLASSRFLSGYQTFVRRNISTWLSRIKYGFFPKIDAVASYAYKGNEFVNYRAADVIERCPKDFRPDVIAVYWSSGFVTARMLRDLHRLTGALIVYVFVDEAPMTGGCHYPRDCRGFLTDCSDCPALHSAKRLSAIHLAEKKKYLKGLPLYIAGVPYDLHLAAQTELFKDAIPLPCVTKPDVCPVPRHVARPRWGVAEEAFVILLGAADLAEERKGILYAIRALQIVAPKLPRLEVIVAGADNMMIRQELKSVTCHYVGMLDSQDLHSAFCASDVFLSPTVADSGPMMVNIAAALGVPTVAFPVGIATTLVRHMETGYLARMKDMEDLAVGLEYMASLTGDARKAMSTRVRQLLDEEASVGTWYEQLLKKLKSTKSR
ncbi:MAG: glycosyltransferase [Bacteroidaceae bacterium]|nr:glycosyltransferase [Bacteroidaceae bacterium]